MTPERVRQPNSIDRYIGQMLGALPAVQVLTDATHPAHQNTLLHVRGKVLFGLSGEEVKGLVRELVHGTSKETEFWNTDRRTGALILLRETCRVGRAPDETGQYVLDAIGALNPETSGARESVTSVTQALHICAPTLSTRAFEGAMEKMKALTLSYDEQDQVYLKGLLIQVIPPTRKERMARFDPSAKPEEVSERLLPKKERSSVDDTIIALKLAGLDINAIVKQGHKRQVVEAVLSEAGLVKDSKRMQAERRSMVAVLVREGASLTEISLKADASKPTIQRDIAALKKAGVLKD